MKRKFLLITISIVLLAGCTPTSNLPIQTSTQQQLVASATPPMIRTIMPTLTVSPSSTIPAEVTSPRIVQNCLEIDDKEVPLNEIAKQGTTMIGGAIDDLPYLLDLQTGARYDLPFQTKHDTGYFFGFHTSPDGNKLAYVEPIENSAKELVEAILDLLHKCVIMGTCTMKQSNI